MLCIVACSTEVLVPEWDLPGWLFDALQMIPFFTFVAHDHLTRGLLSADAELLVVVIIISLRRHDGFVFQKVLDWGLSAKDGVTENLTWLWWSWN